MKLSLWAVLAVLALSTCTPVHAQEKALGTKHAPIITKVDPPSWWVKLPSPMLLIHGEYLEESTVHIVAHDVTVVKQQASQNEHWLFVWLDTTRRCILIRRSNSRRTGHLRLGEYALRTS